MRKNYWSCSKFADLVRGSKKLDMGSSHEWAQWTWQSKSKHPIRFWLAETALDKLQDIIYWPSDTFYNISRYIENRFITKTHALTSNLKKGQYHEFDTRLLHAMFDEFVNFVEIDLAYMYYVCNSEQNSKIKRHKFSFKPWRSPSAGIAYLNDAINTADEYIKPYKDSYTEILNLYSWWTKDRLLRVDIFEDSGFNEFYKTHNEELIPIVPQHILTKVNELENKYIEEDEAMMIRLVKLRRSLWT